MKKGRIERGPRVRRDLLIVFTQIGRTSPEAAERFADAAEATFHRLAIMPGTGEPFDPGVLEMASVRRSPIARFKSYLIYYSPIEGGIRVLRVVHAAREPEELIDADDFE